eukprot:TRINITY_DN12574_c4_g3_i6.p2 TRINITY_DN12574_c4_g3~~TRINITY_DN12574_c4_g3_i6.p2  ORF type:complete len:284 (+),score=28.33 TRINITY_DN12574_c4_g3_i6:220-1071(+)
MENAVTNSLEVLTPGTVPARSQSSSQGPLTLNSNAVLEQPFISFGHLVRTLHAEVAHVKQVARDETAKVARRDSKIKKLKLQLRESREKVASMTKQSHNHGFARRLMDLVATEPCILRAGDRRDAKRMFSHTCMGFQHFEMEGYDVQQTLTLKFTPQNPNVARLPVNTADQLPTDAEKFREPPNCTSNDGVLQRSDLFVRHVQATPGVQVAVGMQMTPAAYNASKFVPVLDGLGEPTQHLPGDQTQVCVHRYSSGCQHTAATFFRERNTSPSMKPTSIPQSML